MNLSKRQKTFLAVFFLGLVALVVDRTILRPQGGPKSASADSLLTSQSAIPSGNSPSNDKAQRRGAAERLNNLWPDPNADFAQMRNPFTLPLSWFDNVGRDGVQMLDPVAVFVSRHLLTAVVLDGRESYALVDDQFLIPGQCLDGFELISVGDRSAVFERDGRRASLELVNK